MDPDARNYDPQANLNVATWCVPVVPGCMMFAATNFNPSATLHTDATCVTGWAEERECAVSVAR